MKAARVHSFGEPLSLDEVPVPEVRPGSVLVRVEAAFIPPSAGDVAGGQLPFKMPDPPYTLGIDAVGVVEAVGTGVVTLEPGQRVFTDHWYEQGGSGGTKVGAFLGYFGVGPGSERLTGTWRDGAYADKVLLPWECVTPVPADCTIGPDRLCRLGYLGTAYGGLMRAGFRPGMSLIVSGATGVIGVGAVLLGLAMGASRIIATGRKQEVLGRLARLDRRITAVPLVGDEKDLRAVAAAAGPGADVAIDCIGYMRTADATMAAISALRPGGHAALVGGVHASLPLPYGMLLDRNLSIHGSLWFAREAPAAILALAGAGALDFNVFEPQSFPLSRINDAISHSAKRSTGFSHTVVVPGK